MNSRSALIRLAAQNPDLRPQVLPLLKESSEEESVWYEVTLDIWWRNSPPPKRYPAHFWDLKNQETDRAKLRHLEVPYRNLVALEHVRHYLQTQLPATLQQAQKRIGPDGHLVRIDLNARPEDEKKPVVLAQWNAWSKEWVHRHDFIAKYSPAAQAVLLLSKELLKSGVTL